VRGQVSKRKRRRRRKQKLFKCDMCGRQFPKERLHRVETGFCEGSSIETISVIEVCPSCAAQDLACFLGFNLEDSE
jgi:hypothetical protein